MTIKRKLLYVTFELMMLIGMAEILLTVDGYWPMLGLLTFSGYMSHTWKIWPMLFGRK